VGRFGTEEEIARACALLAQDGLDFMTGSMLSIDGGWGARSRVTSEWAQQDSTLRPRGFLTPGAGLRARPLCIN
jgi:hypothetical protein